MSQSHLILDWSRVGFESKCMSHHQLFTPAYLQFLKTKAAQVIQSLFLKGLNTSATSLSQAIHALLNHENKDSFLPEFRKMVVLASEARDLLFKESGISLFKKVDAKTGKTIITVSDRKKSARMSNKLALQEASAETQLVVKTMREELQERDLKNTIKLRV